MTIDYWYTEEELNLLEAAAKRAPTGAFLEIGVYKGRSAQVLSRHTETLYLCDNLSMGDFRSDWPKHTCWFRCVAVAAALGPFALIHHDADHRQEVLQRHFKLLLPALMAGGILCLHDFHSSSYPGVQRAWETVATDAWEDAGSRGTLQCFRQRSPLK